MKSRFAFGKKDPLQFRDVPNNIGRIGYFRGEKGRVGARRDPGRSQKRYAELGSRRHQRALLAKCRLLPEGGGGDPLSPKVILFTLNSHLRDNHGWASQMLASSKQMAVVYIVRSLASKTTGELGPFATDGAFFRECLVQMSALTNGSFSFGSVTAMSFSLGIIDLNPFVSAVSKHVPVTRVINLDPQHAAHAVRPKGARAVEFLSGETGIGSGFEIIPEARWVNEDQFATRESIGCVEIQARPPCILSRPLYRQLHAPPRAREVVERSDGFK